MAVSIHPHKGYLNNMFNIYVTGKHEIGYEVSPKNNENDIVERGFVSPNEPYKFKMTQPGEFIVKFSDGSSMTIIVEDGYKYGGGSLKSGYVFDNNPWVIVIMHDRTYFYNRENQLSYIEPISPDFIEEVSPKYIILGNNNQRERTLFSLIEQKPILCVSNIVYQNDKVLIWRETDEDSTTIILYSIEEQRSLKRQKIDIFVVDEQNGRMIYSINNRVESITLNKEFEKQVLFESVSGDIVSLFAPAIAVSCVKQYYVNVLHIYNLDTKEQIKEIKLEGELAKIGNNQIIDTWQRKNSLRDLNLAENGLPEATVSATYYEYNFFPCNWEIFYTEKIIQLSKFKDNKIKIAESCYLKSCIKERNEPLYDTLTKSIVVGDTICMYGHREAFACNKFYSYGNYIGNCSVYTQGDIIRAYKDSTLYTMSRNGFWDGKIEHKYSFEYFDKFGVLEDKETNIMQTLSGMHVGKKQCVFNNGCSLLGHPYIRTDEYYIYPNARKLKRFDTQQPMFISDNLKYGITINKDGVFLFKDCQGKFAKEQIMTDIYDTSHYRDVLLSEDGDYIMHREGNRSIILNLSTGSSEIFDNVSFISHINGMRPLFCQPTSLQPCLVNPITKQHIDVNVMAEYQFISPDGLLYADTRLSEYVEYYNLETNELISDLEYKKLEKKFAYPWDFKADSIEWEEIAKRRKDYVQANIDSFIHRNPALLDAKNGERLLDIFVIDKQNRYGVQHFLNYFVGRRGVAYIRRTSDDTQFARIELGAPLTFINYVSFSYDNKYLALAGYNGRGLLIVYNLEKKEPVLYKKTNRAVWLTAFSKSNALASYTSDPFTFFANNTTEYHCEDLEDQTIPNRSFLTFSPDGKLFALSEQGYVSKYDRYGVIQLGWGHQPSSLVELRKSGSSGDVIACFFDLSDAGIADVASKESVASVSFSNDNKKLMMVGKDGVVIVRNLHLDEYAE